MNFSIKKILPLFALFFACSFLHADDKPEEAQNFGKYYFFEKEDCVKVMIKLPEGSMDESTIIRLKSPDSKTMSVKIKNNSMRKLMDFEQLVDIEIHAYASPEEEGMTFDVIEHLENKPSNGPVAKITRTQSTTYFVKLDKPVTSIVNVLPKLTIVRGIPNIKYVRFYTKP